MANAVLDVHDIEAAGVLVTRSDKANTPHVAAVGDHDLDTDLKGNKRVNGTGLKVDLHGVSDLNKTYEVQSIKQKQWQKTNRMKKGYVQQLQTLMLGSGYRRVRPSWVTM